MSVVELTGVGKRFVQRVAQPMLLSALTGRSRHRQQDFWALRDIDLRCDAGETVAIIGRNGSGKTTLLRLLTGVSAPTEGRVRVVGRVAPLIGVGVGFNPELTGRENVFVSGQLLGLSHDEVAERLDDIVAFSEMAQFLGTPVKYYSSGMFLRLAFSVAAHIDPDVYVVDEVLAVGDAAFQLKCVTRMRAAQERGATIVIVTHNLQLAHDLAPRAILLSHGRKLFDGPVETALGEYQKVMQSEDSQYADSEGALASTGNEQVHVGGAEIELELLDAAGTPRRNFTTGEQIRLRVTARFSREVRRPTLGVVIFPTGLGGIFTLNTPEGGYEGVHGPDRPLHAEVRLVNRLLSRAYAVRVSLLQESGTALIGLSDRAQFFVTSDVGYRGIVDLEPTVQMGGETIPLDRFPRLGEPQAGDPDPVA